MSVRRVIRYLRLRGCSYLGYLVKGYLLPRLVMAFYLILSEHMSSHRIRRYLRAFVLAAGGVTWLITTIIFRSPLYVALASLTFGVVCILIIRLVQRRRLNWMLDQAQKLTAAGHRRGNLRFTTWDALPVNPDVQCRVEREMHASAELELAYLDCEGRVRDPYGVVHLPSCAGYSPPKDRFPSSVVLRDGRVLTHKCYRDDRAAFVREWFFLALLQGKANVPSVWEGCPDSNTLYMNFIPGCSMQEMLAEAGICLQPSDTYQDSNPETSVSTERETRPDVSARACASRVLSGDVLRELDRQLDAVHATGAVGLVVEPDNVMVSEQDGKPYLVNVHTLSLQNPRGVLFHLYRDQDRLMYNRRCVRSIITESSARKQLRRHNGPWYAPIDFGVGLTVGKFWTTSSGTGRWDVFMRDGMPDLTGLRVLDLGSNNGCMPMMMLRSGAHRVVGVELSPEFYRQSLLVHRLFEWRDMQCYDFRPRLGNMLEILEEDWGSFDLVTAFSTLYYLQDEDMSRIVKRAAELAPMMIIQANVKAIARMYPDKPRRASVEFLRRLLVSNGFPLVEVYDPADTARPLLVGHRA